MVKNKSFKPPYSKELLSIASNDLEAARTLASNSNVRPETTLLMVQQAIEKGLKAALCRQNALVPQTHDLTLLVDRLSQCSVSLPDFISETEFDDLTPFVTLRRYEEGRLEISPKELSESIVLAQKVIDWVEV